MWWDCRAGKLQKSGISVFLGTSGIPCPVPVDPQSSRSGFFGCLVTFLYCSKCLRCVFLWILFFFSFWNPNPKVVLPTVVIFCVDLYV